MLDIYKFFLKAILQQDGDFRYQSQSYQSESEFPDGSTDVSICSQLLMCVVCYG